MSGRNGDQVTYLEAKFDNPQAETLANGDKLTGLSTLKASTYDISASCNLTCEGCLFFAREGGVPFDQGDDAAWEARFAAEAARGVNFVYLAGAEPSMVPQRIASAWRHIKAGVVFTNGTRRIDPAIGYRIHVSLWGLGEMAATLRGGDSVEKALRNYARDPRAVFVLTISRANLHQIGDVTRRVAEAGGLLTFSYFSPTLAYQRHLGGGTDATEYMRLDDDMRLTETDLSHARSEIEAAMTTHPETVRYSLEYDDWVRQPGDRLYAYDAGGVATNCGNRLSGVHRHYTHDGQASTDKCCSPNLDCRECRAYAMAMGTFVSRPQTERDARRARLRAMRLWYELFMPLEG